MSALDYSRIWWWNLSIREKNDLMYLRSVRDSLAAWLIDALETGQPEDVAECVENIAIGPDHSSFSILLRISRHFVKESEVETTAEELLKVYRTVCEQIGELERARVGRPILCPA